MVNFICQLYWAMRHPDIWSNIILGVSVRVYLDKTNIWIRRLSKADDPPQSRWAWSNLMKPWLEQRDWPSHRYQSLTDCHELRHSSFPAFGLELRLWLFLGPEPAGFQTRTYTITSSDSWVFRLRLELYHQLSWVSSLSTADLGAFSLHNQVRKFLILYFMYIDMLLVLFLWRTMTNTIPTSHSTWKLIQYGSLN